MYFSASVRRFSFEFTGQDHKENTVTLYIKGGVCHFGENSSSALEFESTQPEKICLFLQTSLRPVLTARPHGGVR